MINSNKPGPMSWIFTPRDLEALVEAVVACSEVVVDLETTGLDENAVTGGLSNGGVAARIVLASFTLPRRDDLGDPSSAWDGEEPTTYVLPLSHPDSPWRGQWRDVLGRVVQTAVDYSRPFANHNVKFDARWWNATTGVDTADLIVWDTQVSSHLLDETRSTKLKERAPETFNVARWDDDMDFSTPGAAERSDLFLLGEYAARDTYWTWRLMVNHRSRMFLDGSEEEPSTPEEREDARLGKLAVWVAMPMVSSLTRIEQRGIRLDVPWVEEHLDEETRIATRALDTLADRYGMDRKSASMAATSKWFKEFTQIAVEKGDLVVAAMTPNGNPQWSKSVLGRQARAGSHVAELILAQRQAAKRAEYLRSWLEKVTPDGLIHTTYWPGRVVTGRLSSSDPNMQQVTYALRPAFLPREGYYIADLDYSQIELRVAAYIARCEPMINAFIRGDDLHKILAARATSKDLADVTPEERQAGKSANFGLLYGMGAYGYREYAEDVYGVVLTEQDAERFRELFFETWDGLADWHADVVRRVMRDGQVVSPLGRVRRLPGIWDGNPKMSAFAERAAINSPVQGMASDFMQMAAASIQGLLPGSTAIPNLPLVGTVHDSIIGEVPIDGWEAAIEEAQERMTQLDRVLARMGVEFDVPLVADATVGTRWGLSDIAG